VLSVRVYGTVFVSFECLDIFYGFHMTGGAFYIELSADMRKSTLCIDIMSCVVCDMLNL